MKPKLKQVCETIEKIALDQMSKRWVSKDELCDILQLPYRQVEIWVKNQRDAGVVIMSNDSVKGFKICNSKDEVEFLKKCYSAQRKRALSALRTCTLYKRRIESYGHSINQLDFEDDLYNHALENESTTFKNGKLFFEP